MKKRLTTTLLGLVFLIGLILLMYPTVSNYWNEFHQSKAITAYAEMISDINEEEYSEILLRARRYNERILNRGNLYALSEGELEEYYSCLDVTGNGVMGYIEIPSIKCSLPIYHGADENVLLYAIGHLDWTSLPVGGPGTHCGLSGHRGLPSARLFTDLDRIKEGDVFIIRVLNEVLTYEVDRILIVEPNDVTSVTFEPDMDYCTLVTCTPYGINTHRLLVRGHRVENAKDVKTVFVTSGAIQVKPVIVGVFLLIPILIVFLIMAFIYDKASKGKGNPYTDINEILDSMDSAKHKS